MSCGECVECCYVYAIDEIKKPKHTLCKFCNGGCSIHGDHPNTCKGYQCEFIKRGWDVSMRPDKCGVLVEKRDGKLNAILIKYVEESAQDGIMEKLKEFKDVEYINGIKGYGKTV